MADGRPPRSFETPGDQYGINTRIMLTAVISLFFVVVIVVLLHLYARCVLRRQARSRATIRQFSLEVAASQANASEPPKTGLDPSVIASLPIIVYKQADRVDEPALECAVCLSAFEEEEMARLLPNCKHSFHVQCIDMWLDSHSTCPICRTGAEPRARVEIGEPGGVVVVAGSEGTSESAAVPALKASGSGMASGSGSRLSSFRRMLSRERSERRSQVSGQGHGGEDIERQ